MKKEYYTKLARLLAEKYTKNEIAQLLVKNKDRKVSNLLTAAYNQKVLKTNIETFGEFNYLQYYCEVNGPDSWLYKYMNKELWEEFNKKLNKKKSNKDKEMFLISARAKWQQEISDSKESDMRRYEWLDRQEMKRLEQSFYEQTADLKCESDEYKNKLNTYRKSMAIYRDLLENAEKRRKMPKAPKSAETFRRN